MFDVDKVRGDFPILKRRVNGKKLVYLDSAATSQKPRQVIESIVDFYENHNANIHRGVHTLSVEATKMVDESREKVAKFIGAKTNEIIFVRNASEGLNLIANSYGRGVAVKGGEIVVSRLEHHSNLVPWQELARERGLKLAMVNVNSDGEMVLMEEKARVIDGVHLGALDNLLSEKVVIVALSAVSNVLGSITRLEEVVRLVRKKAPGAVIVLDGAQLVPHKEVDVMKLGVDFLVFSGHKMLGPTGIGCVWGKEELLRKMEPFLYGGDMINEVGMVKATWAEVPNKFEAGTPDIAGIVGLGRAVDYLSSLGMDVICRHEKNLTEYALEKFIDLENRGEIRLFGVRNSEWRSGVITFNVGKVHAHDAAQVLDSEGIAVRSGQHCGAPLVASFGEVAMVRASFYVYTTVEEIDALILGIGKIKKIFS